MTSVLLLAGAWMARAELPDAERAFVDDIAHERESRGLPALAYDPELVQVARRHAQRMADRGEPYHNPNLGTEVTGWQVVSENVGVGPDEPTIHRAFMDSPTHHDIILSTNESQVGVGVVGSSDGRLWVVEVFRLPESAHAASAPAATPVASAVTPHRARPAPRPAPPTTAPPTTLPPPAPTTTLPTLTFDAVPWSSSVHATSATAPTIVPEVADLARNVPPAAWVAAFMLAAVVGAQGVVVRRLHLAS